MYRCNTSCNTKLKILFMSNFSELWSLLRQHGSGSKREGECAQLWETYSPALQEAILHAVRTKLEQKRFVHYDPLRAITENAQALQTHTLSYADYYARYHTTEPRDGWQMSNPTGNKVIYIKTI